MARACTICQRPDAGAINQRLRSGHSARSVALELALSEDAMQRHAANHVASRTIGQKPNGAPKKAQERGGDPLDELVDALRSAALAGNPAIVHQYRLALEAQRTAAHQAVPERDLATDPEWIALRTIMLRVLEGHPEVRVAIADALAAAGMD